MFACLPFHTPVNPMALVQPTDGRPADDAAALARAAARGSRPAFEALMRRFQGPVFGLCLRLLADRDAAADAAQETFARAWAGLHGFDPGQRFDVWVLRIARNHCYDLLRRAGGRNADDEEALDAVSDPAPLVDAQLEQAQIAAGLEAAVDRLPARDRELIALYYLQRRTTAEIAAVLGCAQGTVMARLFRTRARLRRTLEEVCR